MADLAQTDIYLVVGIVIFLLAVPALLSAWVDRRIPSVAAFVLILSGGLIWMAYRDFPGGLTFHEIPLAFTRVIGGLLN